MAEQMQKLEVQTEEQADRPPMMPNAMPTMKTQNNRPKRILTGIGIAVAGGLCVLGICLMLHNRQKSTDQKQETESVEEQDRSGEDLGDYRRLRNEELPEKCVYVTEFGTKYHLFSDCEHLAGKENETYVITTEMKSDADAEDPYSCIDIAIGYGASGACKTCWARFTASEK